MRTTTSINLFYLATRTVKNPFHLVTDGPFSYDLVLAGQTRAKHSIVHPKTDCFIKV